MAHTTELSNELERYKKRFKYLFESYEDIYFRASLSGEITLISPSSKKVIGFEPNELIGKDITNYYLYSKNTKELLKPLVKKKELRDIEVLVIHRSGKIVPSKCTLRLIYDEKWLMEGVVKDISDVVQQNEELERAINISERLRKVKENFLANMSHEIRTPLNGILGMANVLEITSLSTEQQKHVQAIKESSDILLKLLNNILDWSKLEAGKMNIKLTAVSPEELLQQVMRLYEQKAQDKKLSLNLKLSSKLPDYVLTDDLKVFQVFSNLISNAIKFTPENGKIDVRFYVEKRRDNHILLRGEVRDNGIGIEKEDQEKLFTTFTQLDSPNSKKHEGAGLGLFISKQIIDLLGGEIGVVSQPAKGSNFWFTLMSEVTEREQKGTAEIFNQEKPESSPDILLVDDNRINLEVAGQILKNAGAKTTMVTSGEEAIKTLTNSRFDIILLDIQMPEMNGVELMDWMKKNLKDIPPVIALTAYSGEGQKSKFLSYGFVDFIAKPISPEELTSKVNKHFAVNDQILDREVIAKLVKFGGRQMVSDAIREFCDESEAQIKECFVLLSGSNHKGILDILHTLKGNAGTLGVNRVAQKAKQIEELIKKGYLLKLEEELKGLEYYIKEFKANYRDTDFITAYGKSNFIGG